MSIAALFNIPGTDEELLAWSFAHAAHHLDLINFIYNQTQIALPVFVLDPFNPKDPGSIGAWAYQHQVMHQNQNTLLGINGFDLTSIDWQDQNQVAAWIQLNATEHVEAANITGVA